MIVTTRLYRDGRLERSDFAFDEVSELRRDETVTVWVDLQDPDDDTLHQIARELDLHPLAVEDVIAEHERAKLNRYPTHLFLTLYALAAPDDENDELERSEIDVFVTRNVLVSVRRGEGFPIDDAHAAWENQPELLATGVAALMWAITDVVVDTHFATVQSLDERVEGLEDELFAAQPNTARIQRSAYRLHKHLVTLRRLALPTREIVSGMINRTQPPVPQPLLPYFADVYDHTLRVSDWTDSLRDLASTIIDTNLTSQGNRMNLVMKKLTSWAAIIAVPTLITGFFGMNVVFPLMQTWQGALVATVLMVATSVGLYVQFKRRDWL